MATTRGLHKPTRTDPVLGASSGDDTDVGKLAQDVEDRMVSFESSTLALRPSAGTARRLHRSTDTLGLALDDGTAWRAFGAYSEGTAAAMPSAGALGAEYYQTDTGDYYMGTGTGWRFDRATASATLAGAGPSTGNVPWGTVTGSSIFTRSGSPANTQLNISVGGVYHLSMVAYGSTGATWEIAGATGSVVNIPSSGLHVPISVLLPVAAGANLTFNSGGVSTYTANVVIRRVQP